MYVRDILQETVRPAGGALTVLLLVHSTRGLAYVGGAAAGVSEAVGPLGLPLWLYHGSVVSTGFLALLLGAFTARYMRKRAWWLRVHKTLGLGGAAIALFGALAGFYMVAITTGDHFAVFHAYVGSLVDMTVLATPILGLAQFRYRSKVKRIRTAHRWFGRSLLGLMAVNITLGLSLVELI